MGGKVNGQGFFGIGIYMVILREVGLENVVLNFSFVIYSCVMENKLFNFFEFEVFCVKWI